MEQEEDDEERNGGGSEAGDDDLPDSPIYCSQHRPSGPSVPGASGTLAEDGSDDNGK